MKPQVKQRVVILTSLAEPLGYFKVNLPLGIAGASGGEDGDEALKLSTRFKHEKLFFDLNFRDPESVTPQRNNQVVERESL